MAAYSKNPAPLSETLTIRAAFSSYLILSGIWVLLVGGYVVLSLRNPDRGLGEPAAISGGIAVLWWCWLFGFKITVTKSVLEYRNGFFKSSKIALPEISRLKDAWIQVNVLGRRIKAPRLVVIPRNG